MAGSFPFPSISWLCYRYYIHTIHWYRVSKILFFRFAHAQQISLNPWFLRDGDDYTRKPECVLFDAWWTDPLQNTVISIKIFVDGSLTEYRNFNNISLSLSMCSGRIHNSIWTVITTIFSLSFSLQMLFSYYKSMDVLS